MIRGSDTKQKKHECSEQKQSIIQKKHAKGHCAKVQVNKWLLENIKKQSYIRRYILEECNTEQSEQEIAKHKTKRRMKDKPIRRCRSELWFGAV